MELDPYEEILNIIKCPICMEVPTFPITQCSIGHFICANCRKWVDCCGECRTPYTSTRNFALEHILTALSFPCEYKEFGCKQMINGAQFTTHLIEQCEYRPIICNRKRLNECSGKVIPVESYIEHLKSVHGIMDSIPSYEIDVKRSENLFKFTILEMLVGLTATKYYHGDPLKSYYFESHGHYFLKQTKSVKGKHCSYCWISIVGSHEEAKAYRAIVSLLKDEVSIVGFRSPVYIIHDQFKDIIKNLECFVLPRNFMNPEPEIGLSTPSKTSSSWSMKIEIEEPFKERQIENKWLNSNQGFKTWLLAVGSSILLGMIFRHTRN